MRLRPDPDAFFQKYLYLGVFPMAPFPLNDHALRPGPCVDRQYLDDGPLLSALCGKRWVLEPGVIEAQGARANLFDVAGAAIRYTLDGDDPTERSERYAHPIRLVKTTTVRARAFLHGVAPSSAVTALFHRCPPEPPPPVVHLPDLQPEKASAGWGGAAKKDRSIQGRGLSVAGRRYEKGMGVHAVSDLVYALKPEYKTFVATAGVDDEMKGYGEASVTLRAAHPGSRRLLIPAAPSRR